MFERIYTQHWMSLPKEVRVHLALTFNMQKSGITEIRDQDVISDGTTNEDLKALTLDALNEYVGSKEEFPRAWELALMKANYELNPPAVEIGAGAITIKEELPAEENKEETNDKATAKKPK